MKLNCEVEITLGQCQINRLDFEKTYCELLIDFFVKINNMPAEEWKKTISVDSDFVEIIKKYALEKIKEMFEEVDGDKEGS